MAEELRLALILLGTLAIGSVILHGIWTVRRTVNEERKNAKLEAQEAEPVIAPEEQEAQKLKLKQMEMNFSELQLSEKQAEADGIPVKKMNLDSIYHNESNFSGDSTIELSEVDEKPLNLNNVETDDNRQQQTFTSQFELDEDDEVQSPQLSTQGLEDLDDTEQPRLSGLAAQTEPLVSTFKAESSSASVSETATSVGLEQSNSASQACSNTLQSQTAQHDTNNAPVENEPSEQAQEVFILYVDKSEGTPIDGAKLLPLLLTLGFKYGEMEFFHRHQDNSGRGEILFSLANMYNPGTFDIDNMEQMTTRGLTIFMTLPNNAQPLPTFNMMHNAAKKIADEFSAKVLDDQRRPLDVAIVRSYVERIRRFS